MSPLLVFLVALVVVLVAAPVVRTALHRGAMVDVPNARSSHDKPVVRGGGIAVAAGALIATADQWSSHQYIALAGCAIALGVVGLVDDRRNLSAKTRLVAQVLIPAVVLPLLLDGMSFQELWTWCFAGGVVLWCAAYTNAFNFMDGINGLAATQAIVAGAGFAAASRGSGNTLVVAIGLAIAGAAVGFSPFNVPVARMFLGDVGSYFVGAWLAIGTVVVMRDGVPPEVALAPFLLYLLDTSTTLIRRWRRGERLSEAHREHAYQRLVQMGWAHAPTTALAGASMLVSTALMVVVVHSSPGVRAIAFAAAFASAAAFVALPHLQPSTGGSTH